MAWASLVPPSYPLNAGLGALYGPSILHLLLFLSHRAFTIESNVTINLKPPCGGNQLDLNLGIIKGLRVVQENLYSLPGLP
jgi:hypothetical protein